MTSVVKGMDKAMETMNLERVCLSARGIERGQQLHLKERLKLTSRHFNDAARLRLRSRW